MAAYYLSSLRRMRSKWIGLLQQTRMRRRWVHGIAHDTAEAQHERDVFNSHKVASLITAFRRNGHLFAQLDPLKRVDRGVWLAEGTCHWLPREQQLLQLLDGYPHNGTDAGKFAHAVQRLQLRGPFKQHSTKFPVHGGFGTTLAAHEVDWRPLHEIVDTLYAAWCSTLTAEIAHITHPQHAAWLVDAIEQPPHWTPANRLSVLRDLLRADALEHFLAEKFPASKRFGIEGCEALLPGIKALLRRSAACGVRRVEIGMPHRGRLNVLCNVLRKPLGALCSEMEGRQCDFHVGDVKYHLGQSGTVNLSGTDTEPSATVRVSIAPNPSHLEAIGPVVQGLVRAVQDLTDEEGGEKGRASVLGLLIHGDAAMAGLGIMQELLQLSRVRGFSTGGMIHLVINNQVGFTTWPEDGRSSLHCTDVAKIIGAPVLHANADDPQAVVRACQIAADWRATFHSDIFVDIVGYRRYGHNEQDDPSYTMPLTYAAVARHASVLQQYCCALQRDGVAASNDVLMLQQQMREGYESEHEAAVRGEYRETAASFLVSTWQKDALAAVVESGVALHAQQEPTGLPLATLQWVGRSLSQVPDHFMLHADVASLLQRRAAMVAHEDSRVDWSMAEALAFGTLVLRRGAAPKPSTAQHGADASLGLNLGHFHVRLTGQDVERGTFNQRHAVVYDQRTAARRVAFNHMNPLFQDQVQVWNSPLSEAAVMSFEYGYSIGCRGRSLVLWEAQFGDFANNAQSVIDQFIASGEEKWGQQSGLVLLLPHGYDGQGPDHSSARLERFLSLVNDDADHLPGSGPAHRRLIADTFHGLTQQHGGILHREHVLSLLRAVTDGNGGGANENEVIDILWDEMGLQENAPITLREWEAFMVQFIRRRAEHDTNMFVVNVSTPAQYFHALRRQANLPYKKPLVLFTPKWLLHHRPCTSALKDFAAGTFFNRVIDDGKASDNTRHMSAHPRTKSRYLLPAAAIKRVVLCTGQIYYHLSNARRSRRIRDIVLVRLEQIAPFPHDVISRIVRQYPNAEVVWCQEEPKNMGAWLYVKPRMETAFTELGDESGIALRYIGRPAAASPATASIAIHTKETRAIIDAALDGSVHADVAT